MSELARHSAFTAVDLPIDEYARADTGGNEDVNKVREAASGAVIMLSKGSHGGIVLDIDRQVEFRAQVATQGIIMQAQIIQSRERHRSANPPPLAG